MTKDISELPLSSSVEVAVLQLTLWPGNQALWGKNSNYRVKESGLVKRTRGIPSGSRVSVQLELFKHVYTMVRNTGQLILTVVSLFPGWCDSIIKREVVAQWLMSWTTERKVVSFSPSFVTNLPFHGPEKGPYPSVVQLYK